MELTIFLFICLILIITILLSMKGRETWIFGVFGLLLGFIFSIELLIDGVITDSVSGFSTSATPLVWFLIMFALGNGILIIVSRRK